MDGTVMPTPMAETPTGVTTGARTGPTGPTTGATNGTAAAVARGATGTGALSGPVTGFTTDTKVLGRPAEDGSLTNEAALVGTVVVAASGSSCGTGIGELSLAGDREEEADELSDEVDTMDESRAALWLLLGRLSFTSSSSPTSLLAALSLALSSLLSSLLLLLLGSERLSLRARFGFTGEGLSSLLALAS